MIPVAKLKQNLDFNRDLGELIEVMKLAATLQFNQFRLNRQPSGEFIFLLTKNLHSVPAVPTESIFLNPRKSLPALFILVSSDEGFLGELNALLVDELSRIHKPGDRVIVLGQQGANYLEEAKIDFTALASISDKIDFDQIGSLRDDALKIYKTQVSRVHIIYSRFINITYQQAERETLLPLPRSLFAQETKLKSKDDFLFEPHFDSGISGWAKLWLLGRLHQVFWSAKLAEFAARIMHLEGSIQELNRINQQLRLEYFKYLHGLSDKTIREISASRLINRGG